MNTVKTTELLKLTSYYDATEELMWTADEEADELWGRLKTEFPDLHPFKTTDTDIALKSADIVRSNFKIERILRKIMK
jgi:hypothetical protein